MNKKVVIGGAVALFAFGVFSVIDIATHQDPHGPLSEDQAVENIRNQAGIAGYFSDDDAKEMMRDGCSVMEDRGISALMNGGHEQTMIIVLQNAAMTYCPEQIDDVQRYVDSH